MGYFLNSPCCFWPSLQLHTPYTSLLSSVPSHYPFQHVSRPPPDEYVSHPSSKAAALTLTKSERWETSLLLFGGDKLTRGRKSISFIEHKVHVYFMSGPPYPGSTILEVHIGLMSYVKLWKLVLFYQNTPRTRQATECKDIRTRLRLP